MLKNIISAIFLFSLSTAYAYVSVGPAIRPPPFSGFRERESVSGFGQVDLGDIILESLNIAGPVTFVDLTVKGYASVGPMSGERGQFHHLHVAGPLDIYDVRCDYLAEVRGPLTAEKCTFQDIKVTANEIVLDECLVRNIFIRSDGKSSPTLILKGKTVIKGNVQFLSEKGRIMGKRSQIQGKIINGEFCN
jgi:hypothetical protein